MSLTLLFPNYTNLFAQKFVEYTFDSIFLIQSVDAHFWQRAQ